MRHLLFHKQSSRTALSIPLFLTAYASTCINTSKCENNASATGQGMNSDAQQPPLLLTYRSECDLSWVRESTSTKAKSWLHRQRKGTLELEDKFRFDPVYCDYYEIKMAPQTVTVSPTIFVAGAEEEGERPSANISNSNEEIVPILHNTVIVIPDLLTKDECELIVRDAERIINETQGVKTEKWAVFSHFSVECQYVIDRLLRDHVLAFIELRLPDITERLFHRSIKPGGVVPVPTGMPMEFYWDDPVVIKYNAGNRIAPHEDMRELTIVVPLNPLGSFRPLDGGGTRFWLEGTPTESADNDSGVLIRPSPGSGIIFNGDITHSGGPVIKGTRFVLMTSINLDDEDEGETG